MIGYNFYSSVIKSVPFLLEEHLGKNFFKSIQFNTDPRTITAESIPVTPSAPALYVSLLPPNKNLPTYRHLHQTTTPTDRVVLINKTKNITVYLKTRFDQISVQFSILLETSAQTLEVYHYIRSRFPLNIFLQPYSFFCFLPLPDSLFSFEDTEKPSPGTTIADQPPFIREDDVRTSPRVPSSVDNPPEHPEFTHEPYVTPELNLPKFNPLTDEIEGLYQTITSSRITYKCLVPYYPLVQFLSLDTQIGPSQPSTYVTGSLTLLVDQPWYYIIDVEPNLIIDIKFTLQESGFPIPVTPDPYSFIIEYSDGHITVDDVEYYYSILPKDFSVYKVLDAYGEELEVSDLPNSTSDCFLKDNTLYYKSTVKLPLQVLRKE